MHTHQRDRVPSIVNGDHCISLGIVVIADGSGQWFEKVKTSLFGSKPVIVTAPIVPGVVCSNTKLS